MDNIYPVTIVQSRYHGVYSGGAWLAWLKRENDLPYGWDGPDCQCAEFWSYYEGPVGKGDTPDKAFADLKIRIDLDKK